MGGDAQWFNVPQIFVPATTTGSAVSTRALVLVNFSFRLEATGFEFWLEWIEGDARKGRIGRFPRRGAESSWFLSPAEF